MEMFIYIVVSKSITNLKGVKDMVKINGQFKCERREEEELGRDVVFVL